MEKINKIINLLNQFPKENRFYWINALVILKDITEAQAGYIILLENL